MRPDRPAPTGGGGSAPRRAEGRARSRFWPWSRCRIQSPPGSSSDAAPLLTGLDRVEQLRTEAEQLRSEAERLLCRARQASLPAPEPHLEHPEPAPGGEGGQAELSVIRGQVEASRARAERAEAELAALRASRGEADATPAASPGAPAPAGIVDFASRPLGRVVGHDGSARSGAGSPGGPPLLRLVSSNDAGVSGAVVTAPASPQVAEPSADRSVPEHFPEAERLLAVATREAEAILSRAAERAERDLAAAEEHRRRAQQMELEAIGHRGRAQALVDQAERREQNARRLALEASAALAEAERRADLIRMEAERDRARLLAEGRSQQAAHRRMLEAEVVDLRQVLDRVAEKMESVLAAEPPLGIG